MAGEYAVAREHLEQAMNAAAADTSMSPDVMANALLSNLLKLMLKQRSRKDLASFIEFQLESIGEDEFVVTRGS